MKWINNQKNRRILCKMAKKYNISEMLAQVLINRDLTAFLEDILNCGEIYSWFIMFYVIYNVSYKDKCF